MPGTAGNPKPGSDHRSRPPFPQAASLFRGRFFARGDIRVPDARPPMPPRVPVRSPGSPADHGAGERNRLALCDLPERETLASIPEGSFPLFVEVRDRAAHVTLREARDRPLLLCEDRQHDGIHDGLAEEFHEIVDERLPAGRNRVEETNLRQEPCRLDGLADPPREEGVPRVQEKVYGIASMRILTLPCGIMPSDEVLDPRPIRPRGVRLQKE